MQIEQLSLRGSGHQEAGVRNQDFIRTSRCGSFTVAVLCDGVSLKSDRTYSNSEIASHLCSKVALQYFQHHLDHQKETDAVLSILTQAFVCANDTLNMVLEELRIARHDCQTTMIVLAYRKGRLYGGIAGDGGIVYRQASGMLGTMVSRWKTSSGVYPIGAPSQWRFFASDDPLDPVRSVIAATDGIFDALILSQNSQIFVNYRLLDLLFDLSSLPRKRRRQALRRIVDDVPSSDDKSVVIISDGKIKPMDRKIPKIKGSR